MFTVDTEIAEKLKKENGSRLVNTLLLNHFGTSREKINSKRIELLKEIKELETESLELRVVENETEKAKDLREELEKRRDEKRAGYEAERKKLLIMSNNKEITFDDFMELSRGLKHKWNQKF